MSTTAVEARKSSSGNVSKKPKSVANKAKTAASTKRGTKPASQANTKKNNAVKEEPDKTRPAKKRKVLKADPAVDNATEVKQEELVVDGGLKADDEDIHRWWEEDPNDHSVKWETLEHNGVIFPPPYEKLPDDVKLKYDGKKVDLPVEAEEVAGFYGAMINTDHAKNPVFQANFFGDFKEVLSTSGRALISGTSKFIEIESFDKCDFSDIFAYYEDQRNAKKALPPAVKKRLKQEKDEAEEKYKTCYLDGRKQPVGNFRVEPPGLFRGRGQHPKTGKLKARVQPEQVTLNIGKDVKIPEPPAGHNWSEVRHDNTVSWLAMWKENINGNTKYVFLSQSSSLKGMSDFKKFEKARELKNHVERIRNDYRKELTDEKMQVRQRATAMYLIDRLALRAGGEKGDDEADTVGCCSLRYEHVDLQPPNLVTFDFLGKDSIRYFQQVEVDEQVFTNLQIFKKEPKGPGDDIFDRLDPSILNKHLQSYMPGLTAKVFRTYNASHTMQKQLDQIPNVGTVAEKVVAFNAANREVAILCNHQRTVAKSHEQSVAKIEERVEELVWKKYRLKKMILQLDPEKPKVLGKSYFADTKAFNKTKLKAIHKRVVEREQEKVEKKFARDNEKIKADREAGEDVKLLTKDDLKERLKVVTNLKEELQKELDTGEFEIKSSQTCEKLEAQVAKLDDRILSTRLSLKDKQDNSTVALSTSKINYIDPRLSVMFSKKFEVPLEKLFTKTLREKFAWAIHSADKDWQF
ncbi:DNA topoisomerase 1 [Wickerhamiella sorbophila]|uniref:DNA topoisomerase I n=1 Tax=Wickerhamiella sorbophila TaxID=45607 RepID=A0A2T0FFC8_9ASCO|nr:DNA topoisomerase 1 [Wickerhamiella sorbophila]PRT53702.1 DNA topoisomerase 1 [Wickerhamiella sorbophila]